MSKKSEPEVDWQNEAAHYEKEYHKALERVSELSRIVAEQVCKINNLQETVFILTDIIKELKTQKNQKV